MIKFSFIIPVYNCGQFLELCVKRVVDIGLLNYEIILVDDGSVDNTSSICVSMEMLYPEIRYIYQENQGVSSARNRGIKESKGEFILFVDADDSFDSDEMFQLLKIMENDSAADLAICGMTFDYYYHGNCYRSDKLSYPFTGIMEYACWNRKLIDLYEVNALSPVWNKIFRKDIIVQNKLFFNEDMFLYEDLDFSLRYLACCDTIYISSQCIYHYRQSEDEGNAKRRLKRIDSLTDFIRPIESTLAKFIKHNKTDVLCKQITYIRLKLYIVLILEKISIAGIREIKQMCCQFTSWYKELDQDVLDELPDREKKMVDYLLKNKSKTLCILSKLTYIRHQIAIRIKNTSFYQRRKSYAKVLEESKGL